MEVHERPKDRLDQFLEKIDNPDEWRTLPGEKEPISKEELDIICKVKKGDYGLNNFNLYEPYCDFFTQDKAILPITTSKYRLKHEFIPRLGEQEKLRKLVLMIKKRRREGKEKTVIQRPKGPRYYDIWKVHSALKSRRSILKMPKMKLPGSIESYRPPQELVDEYQNVERDISEFGGTITPKIYGSLREVPHYKYNVNERYSRLLDILYCPRAVSKRKDIKESDIMPRFKDPKELQPFPNVESNRFVGHNDKVVSIDIDSTGRWLLSGSKDKSAVLWDVYTGRRLKTWSFDETVGCVSFNPNPKIPVVAMSHGKKVLILVNFLASPQAIDNFTNLMEKLSVSETSIKYCTWKLVKDDMGNLGVELEFKDMINSLSWHRKGDYFIVSLVNTNKNSVIVNQLTSWNSQRPFKKLKGHIIKTTFHPNKPYIIITSRITIRIYDLVRQKMLQTLTPKTNRISGSSIHPLGDNILVSSLNGSVYWFDVNAGSEPYKTINIDGGYVYDVSYHKIHPLMAFVTHNGYVNLYHCLVYNNILKYPEITPLTTLRCSDSTAEIKVCQFHPINPWVFVAGNDNAIHLFVSIIY